VLQVVEAAVGIAREDLIPETARLLGFDRTGNDLQRAIDKQIGRLLEGSEIYSSNDHIYLLQPLPPTAGPQINHPPSAPP
jgi:hypothetical protein